jgi:hypothetical protein
LTEVLRIGATAARSASCAVRTPTGKGPPEGVVKSAAAGIENIGIVEILVKDEAEKDFYIVKFHKQAP